MRRLVLACLVAFLCAPSAFACDDVAIGRQIAAQWQPQIEAAAGSICETAKVMQRMLADSKSKMSGCLPKNMKKEVFGELDATIGKWRQTQLDACQ